jgi:hypothetical protein
MSDQFENLFARAQTSSSKGKYWSKLDPETQSLITEFLDQAKLSDKSKQSYKSYLSKALVETEAKLTSDQISAVKLFEAWLKS